MVIGGKTPLLTQKELAGGGYAVICYANAALQASTLAMQRVLTHLHAQGSIAGVEDQLMMFKERQVLVNAEHYQQLEKRYQ
jgi:2-methylisocitrate lyase-like PEP mutase family enzyme